MTYVPDIVLLDILQTVNLHYYKAAIISLIGS